MVVNCAGEMVEVLSERCLFWRRTSTLLLADAHLGKASAFRRAGIPVPEQLTTTDLDRLSALLRETGAERLVVIGDLFHAPTGQSEATTGSFAAWRQRHSTVTIDLILGNHDRAITPFPTEWRIRTADSLREGPFLLAHAQTRDVAPFGLFGHIHPAVRIAGLRLPCFHVFETGAVLPAFGSFTGMHSINPSARDRVFVFNEGEVLELPPKLLARCQSMIT